MLPDLVNKIYPIKSKKREDNLYPTTRVDLETQLKAQSFALSKPGSSSVAHRNISTSQPASRYFDKKAIQQRIETRLNRGPSGKSDEATAASSYANFDKVNQIMKQQKTNVKVVTDNISRNVLIYQQNQEGRKKFTEFNNYPDSLKQIDKKITRYKKALEDAIKQQQLAQKEIITEEPPDLNQYQIQPQEENFDFLTGIGLQKQQEEEEQQEQERPRETDELVAAPIQILMKPTTQNPYQQQFEQVKKAFSDIYEQYQKQISKAFIKKDQPKARIKRKNPRINITKNNQISKTGAPFDEVEHLMRVYNKEHVPCQPQILVPSFQQKKDNIANTVLAYLKDYKPLLSGNKANIPKSIQGLLDVELELLKTAEKEGASVSQQQNFYDEVAKNPSSQIMGHYNNNFNSSSSNNNINNNNQGITPSYNISNSYSNNPNYQVTSNQSSNTYNNNNNNNQRHSNFKKSQHDIKGQNEEIGQIGGNQQQQQQQQQQMYGQIGQIGTINSGSYSSKALSNHSNNNLSASLKNNVELPPTTAHTNNNNNNNKLNVQKGSQQNSLSQSQTKS